MKKAMVVLVLLLIVAGGCAGVSTPDAEVDEGAPRLLRVMTYSSFDIGEDVVQAFEEAHNARLQFLDAGDTGQMISQAILSKEDPQADVMYGIDNTFLSRALEGDIFEPYQAEGLSRIPQELQLDSAHRVTPVDYGDVCLNYDRAYFSEQGIALPTSLEDLTEPIYAGLLVVQNPASSSPGLAFMLATIATLGEETYLDYWEQLRDNEVLVVDSWDTAYYGEFSGGGGSSGTRPIVVSYATSPAAEVYYSDTPVDVSPTGAITAPGTCFRQVEFVGILKNGEHRDLAEAFVEYVLGDAFQNDIPLHMWVYPASTTADLPPVFDQHAVAAVEPAMMSVELIERNRQTWIDAWMDVVLR
jgi:thiamine transport system substrate-binding protein